MFQKNMLWPLQFAITTRHIQFQSIHLLLDTKQIFNENTFVTKMWHKHYTALGSSDLNWIPRSSKIGARQAVEDKSKTIYSRAVFVTACDLRLYQVYCFMPFCQGFLNVSLNWSIVFRHKMLKNKLRIPYTRGMC